MRWLGIDLLGNDLKPREGEVVAGLTELRGNRVREARGKYMGCGRWDIGKHKDPQMHSSFLVQEGLGKPMEAILGPQSSNWK